MSESEPDASGARPASEHPLPGGDFRLFVTRLNIQALLALGLIENPVTGKKDLRLDHARALIDDLRMLREKTKGNLDPEESQAIEKSISDLQWQFVERARGEERE
ncbi:MAG TPA: DUF1844 domain-containing protein [Planctomycetota bacterium]|jgi:hypothetical protein|nr:DUF1844 domain-containing protein [Planctomycetota bacterium]